MIDAQSNIAWGKNYMSDNEIFDTKSVVQKFELVHSKGSVVITPIFLNPNLILKSIIVVMIASLDNCNAHLNE